MDRIVQCFEYDNEFITQNIINNLNWINQSIITLSYESLVAIFERNDLNLIEIISSKAIISFESDSKSLNKCIECFIQNENIDLAKFYFNYIIKNDENLVNDCIRIIIENKKYEMANQLLNDLVKNLTLIDSLIKNVLFKMDDKLFQVENVQFEDLIQLKDEQTILHYTAQKCTSNIFAYFLNRSNCNLDKCDNIAIKTPFDILIQEKNILNEFTHSNNFILDVIDKNSNKIRLNHESFVILCERLEDVNDLKCLDNLQLIKTETDTNENGSLNKILQKRHKFNETFYFNEYFLLNELLVKYPSFFDFKLDHKSFENLFERNNATLFKLFLGKQVKFEHEQNDFDKCIQMAILNENEEITNYLLNYMKQIYSTENLIDCTIKYVEISVANYKKPKSAVHLMDYIDKLDNMNELKDSLIKTILKEKEFTCLIKPLLDHLNIKTWINLIDPNQNILHYAAQNCSANTFTCLFDHFQSEFNYMNEIDSNKQQSPLDIIIQRRRSCSSSFMFTSSFVKNLIENNLKNYDKLTINFDSFLAICERKDSLVDRNILIEYLISKINVNDEQQQQQLIEQSPVHYLIQKRQNLDNKFFYSEYLLKRLIEKQSADFRFQINDSSFLNLTNRNDLYLIKLVIEKADFISMDEKRSSSSPLDVLVQRRNKDNMFTFSNTFIKQINENSKIFHFKLNHKSFIDFCDRNDPKLFKKFIEKTVFRHGTQEFNACIDLFIANHNQKMAKCVFDYLASYKEPDYLIEFINSVIKSSITKNEPKMAEYSMDYAVKFRPESFSSFFKNILADETFVKYLLEEKRINNQFKQQTNDLLPKTQNILQYATTKYSSDTFLDLFNVSYEYLNKSDSDGLTPLDLLIKAAEKFDNSFIKRIIFKLPIDFELKLTEDSFNQIVLRMKDLHKDWDTLKIIIERTKFDTFNESPLNTLINLKQNDFVYSFDPSFIKQINLNSNILKPKHLQLQLNHETFENLCERNDSDLFKFIVDLAKFKHGNYIYFHIHLKVVLCQFTCLTQIYTEMSG